MAMVLNLSLVRLINVATVPGKRFVFVILVDDFIAGDPVNPAGKFQFRVKTVQMAVDFDEYFLQNVLR